MDHPHVWQLHINVQLFPVLNCSVIPTVPPYCHGGV